MENFSEIDRLNYMELFKKGKDLALIYSIEHPIRIEVQQAMNKIVEKYELQHI